jgi:hypothetical protein
MAKQLLIHLLQVIVYNRFYNFTPCEKFDHVSFPDKMKQAQPGLETESHADLA